MKHLFESPTSSFLQNNGHWAEASPSQYAWGDDGEFQMNGMNHSKDCPCRREVAIDVFESTSGKNLSRQSGYGIPDTEDQFKNMQVGDEVRLQGKATNDERNLTEGPYCFIKLTRLPVHKRAGDAANRGWWKFWGVETAPSEPYRY